MLIRQIGHAEFCLETESGYCLVTDPYDASCGYPVRNLKADAVLVSHQHHDHNAVDTLQGNPRVIDTAGIHTLAPDVRVTAVQAWHDDAKGAKRGATLLFLLETEGLRVVHLGDLGEDLQEKHLAVLKKPDILMIPVGGYYTIDALQAKAAADQLEARIVLPMHYRTRWNPDWPIADAAPFLILYEEEKGTEIETGLEVLRVTAGDLMCQPKVAVFSC